jgi:glycosyltransferase involved in cell wall biosynthesis
MDAQVAQKFDNEMVTAWGPDPEHTQAAAQIRVRALCAAADILSPVPDTRPDLTGHPVALFVFSNLREQKGGLTRAWLRRLSVFHEAGWDTHIATIHPQPEIDETLDAWRGRGWLPAATSVHHYQRRDKRFRPSWSRRTDETFTRDDRVADWLDWLVGRLPGVVVFADSPVTYAPVAMMRAPYIARIMTVHLAHRKGGSRAGAEAPAAVRSRRTRQIRSRYAGPVGQPRLAGRLLPFAPAADAVVALTRRQAEDLTHDVPGLEVQVIPNMIDPVPEGPAPSRDPVKVVQLGRLDPVKRVDHAMRAVALALHAIPDLQLEVYGRGPELEHLLELRAELGLEQVVSFPGFTEDPIAVLAGAGASLMTSRREGFGLAVAESLAARTPVVTYDVDYGPGELVEDGVNGRVVADGSIERLATALVEVLSDARGWARMSEAAPAAVQRLRPEVVAAQWLDLASRVARTVQIPDSALLVEDLRVRRSGLVVEGVALGRAGDRLPQRVSIPGGIGMPLRRTVGDGAEEAPPGPALWAHEVSADLPWPAVADWPSSAALIAWDPSGMAVPVLGPGLTVTVAPTDAGPVILGWDDESGEVRRLPDLVAVPITGRVTSVRATVDEDVTVLSDVLFARALVSRSLGASTEVRVELRPGLTLTDDSVLAVAAGVGDWAVRVGAFRLVSGGEAHTSDPEVVKGTIDWDPDGLVELGKRGAGPAPVRLAVGRSLRTVGSVDLEPGRVLSLGVGDRWVLAPSSTGGAMLVGRRGWRIRAARVVRRMRGNRRSV